jgi:hypothetical protein
MITTELYEKVLVEPIRDGADHLLIVSGYATSAMAFRHLDGLRNAGLSAKVDLIVGMCVQDGLSLSNHKGFQKIVTDDFAGIFKCSYLFQRPPVHSKVYVWLKDGKPIASFAGSANYSQFAFSRFQREVLTASNPQISFDYFDSLITETIFCDSLEVENLITIYSDQQYRQRFEKQIDVEKDDVAVLTKQGGTGDEVLQCVTVSFLDRKGEVPGGASGLNWGFRPDHHRKDLNAAYVQLPPSVYKSDFFPIRGTHFTVLTDDGKSLICTRAAKDERGHQIETPHNNQLLGEYFRNRLGIPYGQRITKQDFERYGRSDVTFCKIDDETFEMDFSV